MHRIGVMLSEKLYSNSNTLYVYISFSKSVYSTSCEWLFSRHLKLLLESVFGKKKLCIDWNFNLVIPNLYLFHLNLLRDAFSFDLISEAFKFRFSRFKTDQFHKLCTTILIAFNEFYEQCTILCVCVRLNLFPLPSPIIFLHIILHSCTVRLIYIIFDRIIV